MIRKYRIPTKPTLLQRAIEYAETSWVPTIAFYAAMVAGWVAVNWERL